MLTVKQSSLFGSIASAIERIVDAVQDACATPWQVEVLTPNLGRRAALPAPEPRQLILVTKLIWNMH